jgi:hypothetical protein
MVVSQTTLLATHVCIGGFSRTIKKVKFQQNTTFDDDIFFIELVFSSFRLVLGNKLLLEQSLMLSPFMNLLISIILFGRAYFVVIFIMV